MILGLFPVFVVSKFHLAFLNRSVKADWDLWVGEVDDDGCGS